MTRATRRLLCLAALCLLAAAAGATTSPTPAAAAPRDPFFPGSGNVGYDVRYYDADLHYRPSRGWLTATVRIRAEATQGLRRFSLDLRGFEVRRARVNGRAAAVSRGRGKLRLRPAEPIATGKTIWIGLTYRGRPRPRRDPDGSVEGWVRTADGAVAVGQPVGTATWLACNNTPRDKAGFGFHITVPARLKAVANGRLSGVERGRVRATYNWVADEPMAPYLAVVSIGRGELVRDTAAGIPSWTFVDPPMERVSRPVLAQLPEAIRFLSRLYGPYPFSAAGSIVDPAPLGYALETQTRPIYTSRPDLTTLVHETAHQWFGDSVGLRRWPQIWLNEGFATWSEWYYAERHGGQTARQVFRRLHRVPAADTEFWEPPSARLGSAKDLFATSTYVRGAMALEALRITVGTRPMLRTLRRWATENRHRTANIRQFVALAEEISGRQLDRLFRRWLYQRGKP